MLNDEIQTLPLTHEKEIGFLNTHIPRTPSEQ